jgi:uncharacterized membrane protein
MGEREFRNIRLVTLGAVGLAMGMAVWMNNVVLGLLGVIVGLIFLTLVKRRVKAVVEDERSQLVGLKAARATYVVFAVVLMITSLMLVGFGRWGTVPATYLTAQGIILSYLTIFLILLYSVFYGYFEQDG